MATPRFIISAANPIDDCHLAVYLVLLAVEGVLFAWSFTMSSAQKRPNPRTSPIDGVWAGERAASRPGTCPSPGHGSPDQGLRSSLIAATAGASVSGCAS